ncbi:site-specific integrase [Rhodanobacter sp. L36]|uniref:site-specific integrase n=1 Tax=Rhodanobacter sp. L36 TaxID=1747221 RepID=UPI00131A6D1E|nr:site-specific integrase [Rhodanobacter sp. L36]
MKQGDLDELTQRYLAATFDEIEDRLALDWTAGGLDVYSSQLNERCHELSQALAAADVSSTIELAVGMAPEAEAIAHRKLARRLIEAQLHSAHAELRALAGEPLRRPEAATRGLGAAPQPKAKVSPRVSAVCAMYSEERIAQGKWTPKTAEQSKKIFQLIAGLLGDPFIHEVSKDHVRQLGLDITRLPANMTKRYPGLTAREVLSKVQGDATTHRLEPRSVNKHYQHVRTLFRWAADHDHIAQSPATILREVEEGRAQDARKAFDDADIVAFFSEAAKRSKEPYGLWVPRIMALTGCRMGEAAQLRKVDIRVDQGIPVFDFNEESDEPSHKTLKTDGSTRVVPIHPRLLDLGILAFAESCSGEFLFPERVRYTANDKRGNVDRLSKQLTRWLRSAGVTDPKKKVQSFRGTMTTRLKDLGVPEYHIAELAGHENDNITTGRYGKRSSLPKLLDVLALLVLPV